ncbi:DUF469 family protein, partial [Undibacterium jejuense]
MKDKLMNMNLNKWNRKYNHRQRKKMCVGEYQELVFIVTANGVSGLSVEQRDKFMDEIIDSAIEANCALSVATFGEDFWCYVMAEKKRASVTEAQRSAI